MTDAMKQLARGLRAIITSKSNNFVKLAKAAGLDPARDFRHADLSGVDLSGCKLKGWDLSHARLLSFTFDRRTDFTGAKLDHAIINPDAYGRVKGLETKNG